MQLANERGALDFAISMYCGQMLISGRVAPAGWWYDVTTSAVDAEVVRELERSKVRDPQERERMRAQYGHTFQTQMQDARSLEVAAAQAGRAGGELTLIEVTMFPAVGTQGSESGGVHMPVARIPLPAVDVWWIASGGVIPGRPARSGPAFGVGAIFPIG